VDVAATTGQAEAGAMARLLGGTARSAVNNSFTAGNEQPDQPDVLQRRFNFFDYSVHGHLQGSVSIAQFKLLNKYILPTPTAYTITDRQRASANGFLIAPAAQRNFKNLQHLLPKYTFVPKGKVQPYKGTTPAQFGVNSNLKASTNVGPVYTLFDGISKSSGVSNAGSPPAVAPTAAPTTPATASTASPGSSIAATIDTTTATINTTMKDSGVTQAAPMKLPSTAQQSGSGVTGSTVAATTPATSAPATSATSTPVATPVAAVGTPVAPAATSTASNSTGTASQSSNTANSALASQIAAILAPSSGTQVTTSPAVPLPPTTSTTTTTTKKATTTP
jgi:hypothetical protein